MHQGFNATHTHSDISGFFFLYSPHIFPCHVIPPRNLSHFQSDRPRSLTVKQVTANYPLPSFVYRRLHGFSDPESVIRNQIQDSKKWSAKMSVITLQSVLSRECHSHMESDWNSMQTHVRQWETTLVALAVTPNILSYGLSWLELVHLSLGS